MICPVTGKNSHKSREKAKTDLKSLRASRKRKGFEWAVYPCTKCGGFHIGRKYAKKR